MLKVEMNWLTDHGFQCSLDFGRIFLLEDHQRAAFLLSWVVRKPTHRIPARMPCTRSQIPKSLIYINLYSPHRQHNNKIQNKLGLKTITKKLKI